MGNPFLCQDYSHWQGESKQIREKRNARGYSPFPKSGCLLCDQVQHSHEHDSVYVESEDKGGCLKSREFIVFDHKQTYPELLIYYKRKHVDEIIVNKSI